MLGLLEYLVGDEEPADAAFPPGPAGWDAPRLPGGATLSLDELRRIRTGPQNSGPGAGFLYWLRTYGRLEDKDTHREAAFRPYPAQAALAARLARGEWVWILKARRLGFTWLLVAYAVWRVSYWRMRRVLVLNQTKTYAQEFLARCRFMTERLPGWLRAEPTRDTRSLLEFDGAGHGGALRSLPCTREAIRSLDADLVVLDEAAYMPWLKEVLRAAAPALETGRGQLVGLSTSRGPAGAFYEQWNRASDTAYGAPPDATDNGAHGQPLFAPVFCGWRARPGRDEAWHAREADGHRGDPLYLKREYPAAPEEAWESAAGRVYPLFARDGRFLLRLDVRPEWPRFRALDWGGADPFVCLWLCEVPGAGPGFSVDPACVNLIRELVAYSWADGHQPADRENHGPDALRYAVVSFGRDGLRGHVHVYRELYVADSAGLGLSPVDLAARVREAGAAGGAAEASARTVADGSRPDSINLFRQLGIPTVPHRRLGGGLGAGAPEIVQGIHRVAALIAATANGGGRGLPPPARTPHGGLALEARPPLRGRPPRPVFY